jgi:hypothetical protein
MSLPAALLALTLALPVLAVPHAPAAAQWGAGRQVAPETVMAFRATGQELVFRVPTGGCTTAGDFRLDVQRSGSAVSVSFARQRPDHCKGRFPEGIEIAIPYGDVGLQAADRIRLLNAVVPPAQ